MPVQFLLFITLIILLYFLSRNITQYLYIFFLTLTGRKKLSIYLLAIMLLPGTLIHEFAHLIVATILRVPTGRLSVIPEIGERGEVKTGRLALARTDPFRYTLIGIAPLIVGLILIYLLGNQLFNIQHSTFNNQQSAINYQLSPISDLPLEASAKWGFRYPISNASAPTTHFLLLTTILIYLAFVLSNTMFSSRKDLEALVLVVPIVTIIAVSLHLTGVKIILDESLMVTLGKYLTVMNKYLLLVIILNLVIFLLVRISTGLILVLIGRK